MPPDGFGVAGTSLRQPPANVLAEQALLGSLLASNRALDRVLDLLEPESFSDAVNGRLYEIIRDRVTTGLLADAVTLRSVLDGAGILDEVGGTAYLAQLLSAMVAPLMAADYAATIRDAWLRRQLLDIGRDITELAFGADPSLDAAAQIASAERALAELGTGGRKGAVLSSLGAAVHATLARATAAAATGQSPALMTGLAAVDQALGGLWAGEMTILAGVPGSGKSALAMGIGTSVAQQGKPVLFLSREMSSEQLAARIAGQRAGISARSVMRGDFDMLAADRLVLAEKEMHDWPLDIYDCRRTPLRVLGAKTRMLLQRKPAALVILDHLLVADPEQPGEKKRNSGQDAANVEAAATAQKDIAGDFNIPFLVLTQMNRPPSDNRGRRPTMQSLKYGGEAAADSVAFIHRPILFMDHDLPPRGKRTTESDWAVERAEHYAKLDAAREVAELIVAKNRMDEGAKVVKMRYVGALTQFQEWSDDAPPAPSVPPGELWSGE
jgi:replicative DNA helicase